MPVYNAAPFLRECIDSILCQTFPHFELLIVDDGSTDGSRDIVRGYADPRIRLIENRHDYIGSLNRLLDEARGRYIARMDADDIMLPERLQIQYDYMEAHPETDVLGGALCVCGREKETLVPPIIGRPYKMSDILKRNCFINPTTMTRRESLLKSGVRYEREYIYAEDYRFWAQLLKSGAQIVCTDKTLVKYRCGNTRVSVVYSDEMWEVTRRIQSELTDWITEERGAAHTPPAIVPSGRRLSVIIPFLNEEEEVVETVKSVRRTAGDRVDIIVINDQSTDDYPYESELAAYGVYYFYNRKRKGVAASRDFGIDQCKTPYFLLLDAHMRLYDAAWPDRLAAILDGNDRCLLCCQGRYLQKKDGVVSDKPGIGVQYGAYLPFVKGGDFLGVNWSVTEITEGAPPPGLCEISAVLGAGYAGSCRYWKYLHGLEGLKFYGKDETFISLKVWLEGGKCLLVKDVTAGHIYRDASPFVHFSDAESFNSILIAYLLLPQSWRCVALASLRLSNRFFYEKGLELMKSDLPYWESRKAYYRSIFTVPFGQVLSLNRRACAEDIRKLQARGTQLPQIADFIVSHLPESDYGLCEGRMGCLIWLCHYERFSGEKKLAGQISSIWGGIHEAVMSGRLALNFRHGLAGIGWGILYLYENGFLEDDPGEILSGIDRDIRCFNPLCAADAGLDTGCAGVLAYGVARLRHAAVTGNALTDGGGFTDRLREMADYVLEHSAGVTEQTYALQLQALLDEGYDTAEIPLALCDWMAFGNFIPANPEHFEAELTGSTLSTSVHILLTYEQTNKK